MSKLERLFRSTEEIINPVPAIVSGDIPEWLNGSLLRIGPGMYDITKDFTMGHWCDGYAVIYKFDINNGKVEYSKRYLESEAYKKAMKYGKPVFTEFGTRAYSDPSKNFFSRAVNTLLPDVTDNCSNNLIKLNGSIFATTDVHNMRLVQTQSLETGEKVDFYKLLGIHLMSCHTVEDQNGDSYTIGTSLVTGLKYNLIKIPASTEPFNSKNMKSATIIASIGSRWKTCVSFYHSFGMSENYVVFIEQPLLMNGVKLLSSQVKGKSMKDCLEWTPDLKNRFYIIEKSTGKVSSIKYRGKDAFFMFHHINTYEDNGELIVDVIAHDSPEIVDQMTIENLRTCELNVSHKSESRRFILPLGESIKSFPENVNLIKHQGTATAIRTGDTIELTCQVLTSPAYELPTLNRNYFTKKYKYFYASGLYDKSKFQFSVVKVETESGKTLTWFAGEGLLPGECTFIGRPEGAEEDDGVLLVGLTSNKSDNRDGLAILDARDLSLIAKASLSVHVPNLLHGIFIPNDNS